MSRKGIYTPEEARKAAELLNYADETTQERRLSAMIYRTPIDEITVYNESLESPAIKGASSSISIETPSVAKESDSPKESGSPTKVSFFPDVFVRKFSDAGGIDPAVKEQPLSDRNLSIREKKGIVEEMSKRIDATKLGENTTNQAIIPIPVSKTAPNSFGFGVDVKTVATTLSDGLILHTKAGITPATEVTPKAAEGALTFHSRGGGKTS